jgi:hypothetical protein
MESWVVFASWAEDDEALHVSHWIARETARLAPRPPRVIDRADAIRSNLESALARPEPSSMTARAAVEGVAFFAHGERDTILGSDGVPALDPANMHLLHRRWAHAFACNTGRELARAAIDADLFVGYDVAIPVGWTPGALPEPVRERLLALVTATTFALLEGVRAKEELQRRAEAAAEALVACLIDDGTEAHDDLQALAEQLVQRLVLSR